MRNRDPRAAASDRNEDRGDGNLAQNASGRHGWHDARGAAYSVIARVAE
jgi:hypothetical protein